MELFEEAFQEFVRKGGLDSTSCIREDLEREIREAEWAGIKKEANDKLCPHGQRPLQCSKCYFENGLYGKDGKDKSGG